MGIDARRISRVVAGMLGLLLVVLSMGCDSNPIFPYPAEDFEVMHGFVTLERGKALGWVPLEGIDCFMHKIPGTDDWFGGKRGRLIKGYVGNEIVIKRKDQSFDWRIEALHKTVTGAMTFLTDDREVLDGLQEALQKMEIVYDEYESGTSREMRMLLTFASAPNVALDGMLYVDRHGNNYLSVKRLPGYIKIPPIYHLFVGPNGETLERLPDGH